MPFLLVAFVVRQARTPEPLLPLRIVMHRQRAGAFLTSWLSPVAMFGLFLFMTYYLQIVLGFSAVRTGLAFLPLTASMILSSTQIAARLVPRVRPRLIVVPGLLVAAAGMCVLAQVRVDSSYVTGVLPGLVLTGLGMGAANMTAMATATAGVAPRDAGVTSAMVSTAQQTGGALGTSVLNTVAATSAAAFAGTPAEATVHGFSVALWCVVGVLLGASVLAAALLGGSNSRQPAAR